MAALAVNTVREANTAAFAQHLAETPTYAWEMLQLQSSVLWLKLSKLSPQVRSDRNQNGSPCVLGLRVTNRSVHDL
jgi:hypothetical protein